jgi:hypothetical protein
VLLPPVARLWQAKNQSPAGIAFGDVLFDRPKSTQKVLGPTEICLISLKNF